MGQRVIVAWGNATEKDTGPVIYAENVNTGVAKSSAFAPPLSGFALSFLWIIYNIALLGAEFSILMEMTDSGRSHLSMIESYMFYGQWLLISLMFLQMVRWSRNSKYWNKRLFKALVHEVSSEIGVEFDPDSYEKKCGYLLVRVKD